MHNWNLCRDRGSSFHDPWSRYLDPGAVMWSTVHERGSPCEIRWRLYQTLYSPILLQSFLSYPLLFKVLFSTPLPLPIPFSPILECWSSNIRRHPVMTNNLCHALLQVIYSVPRLSTQQMYKRHRGCFLPTHELFETRFQSEDSFFFWWCVGFC
jgi:hypothetical protein